ncbi:hypothetical protein [endosymbiont GvMRE of Glomus versiforme]|uniref:hypothetical protein n=1 Tax=endosymbiont GvMRE of Glomus versiforme TaxID=2039283 RepID=UPI000EC6DAA1|nr:hypothetical protein [endosymbiont GvMRE of Glomus versiforme]RHZ37150.1 hypothetical protein GvMRE_I1g493 [endosymbiont GvMRE of Glomus versiforme]
MPNSNQEQEIVFKEAFLVSNFLLLWNLPSRKDKLTTELQKEVQERLWNKNTLDSLVLEKLGEESWFKSESERKALKAEDYQRIKELTEETKDFIRQLEKETEWEGTMDKEIENNRNKTIQQWIKENK